MTTPDNFLGLEAEFSAFERARVLVLPIPFEATVSYSGGTADGPAAIIAASQQVELYDREYDAEPALRYGVHTLPALELPDDPETAVDAIRTAVAEAARTGKFVVGLGGEHTAGAACSKRSAARSPSFSSTRTAICATSTKARPTATPALPAACSTTRRSSRCCSSASVRSVRRR